MIPTVRFLCISHVVTSLSFPQTFADRSSMAGRERLSAGSGMRAGLRDDDDKRRLKWVFAASAT